MELHPLAKYYNTPENYKLLNNWIDARNSIPDIDFTIDETQIDKELYKLKDKLDKSIAKIFK